MAKLFFSYSHHDEAIRNELEAHFAVLKRQGIIETWHDRRIVAGSEFNGEIDSHLESSDIILLLVSSHFLNSDYCYDIEMTRALQRHNSGSARVIPVIVEPCDWRAGPFGKLQAATVDGRPLSKFPNPHDGYLEVVNALRNALAATAPSQKPVSTATIPQPSQLVELPRSSNLRIKKKFTDHDKHAFLEDAYMYIEKFFEQSLIELQQRNEGITTRFRRIDSNRFTAFLYRNGDCVSKCTISLVASMGNQITYSYDVGSSNSYNEALSVHDGEQSLVLKCMGMSRFSPEKGVLTSNGAAEQFWEMLMEPLQRK